MLRLSARNNCALSFTWGIDMDRAKFYASIRKRQSGIFGTSLSTKQVEGMEAVLNEAETRRTPLKWLAYMFATDAHETAFTMQPIAEYGKGKGRKYGQKGKYGQVPYGRGLVQLTWDFNYEKADQKLNLNGALLKNFDLALQMPIAVKIMFEGMEHGWFTGKALPDFMSYEPMRKIINGMDKAKQIAGYAVAFETALREAGYGLVVQPRPVIPADTKQEEKYQTSPEVIQKPIATEPIPQPWLHPDADPIISGDTETRPEVLLPPIPAKQSPFAAFIAFILSLFKRKTP